MKKIVIIRDRLPPNLMGYAIDHYALRWKQAGYKVIDHIGLYDLPEADVYIVHIDLSVIPDEYVNLIKKIPRVINGNILDISRRKFSKLLLSKQDTYSGRVIVKTNANFGGRPEKKLNNKQFTNLFQRLSKRWSNSRYNYWSNRWSKRNSLTNYLICENIKSVPNGVWENDNLVVERFIHESKELYSVRYYSFFGDKELSGRITSHNPEVKFSNCHDEKSIPLPDEVKQWRKDLKIDLGRFDYLEADGQYFLIDVNKTQGGGNLCYKYADEMDLFASAIEFYLN